MARTKRKTSELGLYTVVLRTKKLCFKSDDAKCIFFDTLKAVKEKDDAKVLCYAIGNKDAYLVVKENAGGLSNFVKKLCISFTSKFKKHHKSVSSVFYDRYLSEPINNESDLMDSIVNIHLLKDKKDARGKSLNFVSSFDGYFENPLIDSDEILTFTSKEDFLSRHNAPKKAEQFMVVEKLTDKQIADYIFYTYNIRATELNKINKPLLNEMLTQVVNITKASARQIGRVTQISLRHLWGLFKKKDEKTSPAKLETVKESKWKKSLEKDFG